MLHCQIAGHLSWAPSKVICQNEKQQDNMEEAENTNSSASGDSFSSQSKPNVYRKSW